jgi:hypothetical protein
MVASYVSPGKNKRKLLCESHLHTWDPPYLFRVCSDGLLRRKKASRSLNDATHHHMEDIMGHFALMQRFGRVNSFG